MTFNPDPYHKRKPPVVPSARLRSERCVECGASFATRNPLQECCGTKCSREREKRKQREAYERRKKARAQ